MPVSGDQVLKNIGCNLKDIENKVCAGQTLIFNSIPQMGIEFACTVIIEVCQNWLLEDFQLKLIRIISNWAI